MQESEIVDIRLENGELVFGKDRFRQFIIRSFTLHASELRIIRSYYNPVNSAEAESKFFGRTDPRNSSIDFTKASSSVRLRGQAKIGNDSLSIIGSTDFKTNEVTLEITEIDESEPEFTKFAWRAHIFLLAHDWEIGNDDQWCVSVRIPRKVFDELATVIESKKAGALSLSLETDLWARDYSDHAVPAANIVWYLRPDEKGRVDRPKSAFGIITDYAWSNSPLFLTANTEEGALPQEIHENSISSQLISRSQPRTLEKAIYFVGFALLILAAVESWR